MNDQLNKYKFRIILIVVGILVIIIGGFFFANTEEDGDILPDTGNNIEGDLSNGGVEFEVLPPQEPATPAPQIERPVVFKEGIPENVKTQLRADFERVTEVLKSDHLDIAAWKELGTLRKGVEDYEGAVEAWEYALLLSPENMVIALNLAGVHGYFIRDFAEAERYYYEAIEYNSASLQAYGQAYEFFSGVVQDQEKALSIIDLGIQNNPHNVDLKEFRKQITGE